MEEKKNSSGLVTAGLILGIIGVLLSAIPIINNFAALLGLLAVIFAITGLVKSKKNGSKKGKAITALVLGLVTLFIVIVSQMAYGAALNKVSDSLDKATGGQSENILKNDVDVKLGAFTVTTDQYGIGNSTLPVTVTNKTNKKASFTIEVEAVDASGARIDSDTVYANDVAAGQSAKYDIFKLVTSDKYDAMKAATFKVSSASES